MTVHIKSEEDLRLPLLLTHRRTLNREMLDIENEVGRSIKVFGVRLGSGFGHAAFAKHVGAALAGDAFLLGLTEPHAADLGGAVGGVQPAPQIARACRQLSRMIAAARWMAARKLRAVLS